MAGNRDDGTIVWTPVPGMRNSTRSGPAASFGWAFAAWIAERSVILPDAVSAPWDGSIAASSPVELTTNVAIASRVSRVSRRPRNDRRARRRAFERRPDEHGKFMELTSL